MIWRVCDCLQVSACYCAPGQYSHSSQHYRAVTPVHYSAPQSQTLPPQQTGTNAASTRSLPWALLGSRLSAETGLCVLIGALGDGAVSLYEIRSHSHSEPVSFPSPHSSALTFPLWPLTSPLFCYQIFVTGHCQYSHKSHLKSTQLEPECCTAENKQINKLVIHYPITKGYIHYKQYINIYCHINKSCIDDKQTKNK